MNRRQFNRTLGLGVLSAVITPRIVFATPEGPTLEEIRHRGSLRIGASLGTEPYYHKNIASGEWSGFCVSLAGDLAKQIGVKLEVVETTWGNSVMDMQSKKIDIMFGLSKNEERAKTVDFTDVMLNNTFTVIARENLQFAAWQDLNRPEVRVAVDLGSTHDVFARRELPNCTLIALKGADDAILALQSGRADALIQVALLSVVTHKRNPRLGKLVVPVPLQSQPTTIGVRRDPNGEFRDYVNTWLQQRRSEDKVNGWIIESLSLVGVMPADLPETLKF